MFEPLSLVITAGSLGDALLTLPAIKLLRSRSQVTVAGTSPFIALGADLLGIHQTVPLDPLLQDLLSDKPLGNAHRDFLSRFHDVFIFFKERDALILEKLASLSKIQVHFPKRLFAEFLKEARWAAEYWLECAYDGPLPEDSPFRQAKLEISDALRARGGDILRGLGLSTPLILHPGSGSSSKNAPLDFFRDAAKRAVKESQKQVLIIWGEAEEADLDPIRKTFSGLEGVKVLEEPLPLRDLVGVFAHASAYLGNDSGVTHLASACGLRTFALFNTTDARVWGPHANSIILSALKGNLR